MYVCGCILLVLIVKATISASSVVKTANGPISGSQCTVDDLRVWQFLGIPFARPPVGPLRLREPKSLTQSWIQPLPADKPPNGCLQVPINFMNFPKHLLSNYSEDCLYLNIWTPTLKSKNKPVMLWIHGGGFSAGESLPIYNGKILAAFGDVVVVVIQYRVGYMGFARFDDKLVPGNNGLLDQQLAMKWVHNNIAQFGGDPQSVTIFGESAGSASVAYHLVNKVSGRYFKRAIMQSGSFSDGGWSFNPNTQALEDLNRRAAAKYLNCDQTPTNDLLKCLQTKTEDEMRTMLTQFTIDNQFRFMNGPTIDGRFLSRSPFQILASGDVNRRDLIIGLNEREGSIFTYEMAYKILSATNTSVPVKHLVTDDFAKIAIDRLIKFYPSYPHILSSVTKEMIVLHSMSHSNSSPNDYNAIKLSETLGQLMVDCDIFKFVDEYRVHHDNIYFYEMAHKPSQPLLPISQEEWMKCSHADDIPFIFGLPLIYPDVRQMKQDERLLSRRMIGDWTHFARTGKPLDPIWRSFTMERKEFYRYKLTPTAEAGDLSRHQCNFWSKMLPLINNLACEKDSESKCKLVSPSVGEFVDRKVKDEL